MGRRGPQPLPSERHVVRGTFRADRHSAAALSIEKGIPEAPDFGDGPEGDYARGQWARLVPMLGGMGVLTPNDRTALEIHCMTYADWAVCWDWVRAHGRVNEFETKEHGTIRKEHPEALRVKQLLPLLAQQLASFGLTPASRGNVLAAPGEGDKEKREDFFSKFGTG